VELLEDARQGCLASLQSLLHTPVICVGDLQEPPAQIVLQNLLEKSRPGKSQEGCEDTD